MNQKALKNLLRERTPEAWLVAADLQEDLGDPEGAARTRETAKIVGVLMHEVLHPDPQHRVKRGWVPLPHPDFEALLGGGHKLLVLELFRKIEDDGPNRPLYVRRLTQHLSWTSIRCTPGHLFKRLLEVAESVLNKGVPSDA